eukprot:TRINITY_DN7419_c0_g1_i1.p1 TRINITY_DN7419_c0_g1~~TRINITY_DN7419_c0_g1_i1.p1  ORF type:complete len:174 (+),score=39.54 TRINITY_DN7419_c0_g1_i1:77-598(+)
MAAFRLQLRRDVIGAVRNITFRRLFSREAETVPGPKPGSAADVPDRPPPPEPRPIVEPGQNINDWDRDNPNFKMLVQQIVGGVAPRAGGSEATGQNLARSTRLRPKERGTSVAQGRKRTEIPPGKLNHSQLKELLRSHEERPEDERDAKALAAKFGVEPELVQRIVDHVSIAR